MGDHHHFFHALSGWFVRRGAHRLSLEHQLRELGTFVLFGGGADGAFAAALGELRAVGD